MYILHLVIFTGFLILGLISITVRVPDDITKDGVYLVPFYKMAGRLRQIIYSVNPRIREAGKREAAVLKRQLIMLNPVGNKHELISSFQQRRLGKALFMIFGGNLLALIICLTSMSAMPVRDGGMILRNRYGGGEKKVTLDIYADGESVLPGEILNISERRYTEEEIAEQFNEIGELLEKQILGKNKSLEVVCYDLDLVNSVEGYPVTIEWELDNYDIMNGSGEIVTDNTQSTGTVLNLTARIRYFDFSGEHHFQAVVYPPRPDSEESFIRHLKETIALYESKTLSYEGSILPSNVDGKDITYEVPNMKTGMWVFLAVIILSLVIYKSSDRELISEIKKRDIQMMADYPQIVSKLTLLIGAGMTIQGAFTKLSADYESRKKKLGMRFAYEEMLLTVRQLKGGVSEGEAYVEFGNRCRVQKYVKLGALLSQNLKKGAAGLLETLEAEERDAFEERKALARRLGEEAGTKLLAPMGIMLVIVMIIIIVPAFLSF